MGTKSEIHIRTKYKNGNEVIELWKHWDGCPSSMRETFTEFAGFMKESCGSQPHRLFYPSDLSALLIAKSYLDAVKQNEMFKKDAGIAKDRECYPDIRPRGNIEDCEYIYLLEITSPDNTYANAVLHVKVYSGDSDQKNAELREMFKQGTEPKPTEPTRDEDDTDEDVDEYEYDIPLNLPGQSAVMCN